MVSGITDAPGSRIEALEQRGAVLLRVGELEIGAGRAHEGAEGQEDVADALLVPAVVEVGPGESIDVEIDPAKYVLQLTTVGQTDGTVQISIE